MLMIAGMHLLGLVCVAVLIIPALRERPGHAAAQPMPALTTAGGWGPTAPPKPPAPPRGGIPLPDAVPASRAPARPRTPRRSATRAASAGRHASPTRTPVRTWWAGSSRSSRAVALAADPLADREQLDVQPRDRVPRAAHPDALDDRQRRRSATQPWRHPWLLPKEMPGEGLERDHRDRSGALSAAALRRRARGTRRWRRIPGSVEITALVSPRPRS